MDEVFIRRRLEDADRLTERLGRLEWSGRVVEVASGWRGLLLRLLGGVGSHNVCPVCSQSATYGHTGDCWLGMELHGYRPSRSG